jgi:Putative beta barrel porin-7 (BBP7)
MRPREGDETMKRILAGGVSVTLGLAAVSSRADEIVWRAAGTPAPTAAPAAPAQPVAVLPAGRVLLPAGNTIYRFQSGPGRTVSGSNGVETVGWMRVRAQSGEELPVESPPKPAEKELPPVPIAASIVAAPEPAPVMPLAVDFDFDPAAEAVAVSAPQPPAAGELTPAPKADAKPLPATNLPPVATVNPPAQVLCEDCFGGAQSRAPRLQATAEYLLWWAKGSQVPPLLTTSPPNGVNGIPGTVPGSTILVGGEDLDTATRNGARFGLVLWCDQCASYGFDGRYFFTGQQTTTASVSSLQPDGTNISLFRPFFAPNSFVFGGVTLPGPFREQVTANGIASGTFTARSTSFLWGAEANYRDCLWYRDNCGAQFRADLLLGFRYLHLDEDLRLSEDAIRLVPSVDFPDEVAGTRISLFDQFSTSNDFYGGQIGTVMTYTRNRWSADMRGTVALGSTHQALTITGGQVRGPLANGGAFVAQGGLLALPTNIGEFSRNVFSVVPEIGINLGYQVTDHWRAFVGYNFLYWSNIVRPGDQIDPVIDVTRIPRFVPPGTAVPPDGARPAVLFNRTDFWVQGINFGAEYRW